MNQERTCSFDGCENAIWSRELCGSHYSQIRRGKALTDLTGCALSKDERFNRKVEKTEGCWHWKGGVNRKGYGTFWDGNSHVPAHRWSYERFVGTIGSAEKIDHKRFNVRCVNPQHLRATTHKENLEHRRGAQSNNSTGIRGASFHTATGKFAARVKHHGKGYHLGLFETAEEAGDVAARKRAELFTHDDMNPYRAAKLTT